MWKSFCVARLATKPWNRWGKPNGAGARHRPLNVAITLRGKCRMRCFQMPGQEFVPVLRSAVVSLSESAHIPSLRTRSERADRVVKISRRIYSSLSCFRRCVYRGALGAFRGVSTGRHGIVHRGQVLEFARDFVTLRFPVLRRGSPSAPAAIMNIGVVHS
jgi:hypothetical protein